MPDQRAHPLLQQTPLTVNPFIDLPKPPTLPHNYASLPSTLPPTIINSGSKYITSPSGDFSAHPQDLLNQSQALLEQLQKQREEGRREIERWEGGIRERELVEKRRKAPGWLDSEVRVLEPERRVDGNGGEGGLMDAVTGERGERRKEGDELGDAMDRAFGRGLS